MSLRPWFNAIKHVTREHGLQNHVLIQNRLPVLRIYMTAAFNNFLLPPPSARFGIMPIHPSRKRHLVKLEFWQITSRVMPCHWMLLLRNNNDTSAG